VTADASHRVHLHAPLRGVLVPDARVEEGQIPDVDRERAEAERARSTQERLETLCAALSGMTQAAEEFRSRVEEMATELGQHAVELALLAARKVTHQEVEGRKIEVSRIIEGVVAHLGDLATGGFVVKVHPDDLARVEREISEQGGITLAEHLVLRADEGAPRGGCIVETGHGKLLADWRTELAILEEEILGRSLA